MGSGENLGTTWLTQVSNCGNCCGESCFLLLCLTRKFVVNVIHYVRRQGGSLQVIPLLTPFHVSMYVSINQSINHPPSRYKLKAMM